MSDKIVVPEGMWDAARRMYALANSLNGRTDCSDVDRLMYSLEAALHWLSENPIVPTPEQLMELNEHTPVGPHTISLLREWQRRMFLAPDPDAPIKDLLAKSEALGMGSGKQHNDAVREAYRRGKEGK